MFILQEITETHRATVKTGSDFPKYVQAIIKLGVASYVTFVTDGHTVYYGKDGSKPQTEAKYPALQIVTLTDKESFHSFLKLHQQGKSDFMTFCNDCAEAGVEQWVVDTTSMTCTYYEVAGNAMLIEKIPS